MAPPPVMAASRTTPATTPAAGWRPADAGRLSGSFAASFFSFSSLLLFKYLCTYKQNLVHNGKISGSGFSGSDIKYHVCMNCLSLCHSMSSYCNIFSFHDSSGQKCKYPRFQEKIGKEKSPVSLQELSLSGYRGLFCHEAYRSFRNIHKLLNDISVLDPGSVSMRF